MKINLFKWCANIGLVVGLLWVFGALDDMTKSPITTIIFLGFYVQAQFAQWGLSSIGWVVCAVYCLALVILLWQLINWVINCFRRLSRGSRGQRP